MTNWHFQQYTNHKQKLQPTHLNSAIEPIVFNSTSQRQLQNQISFRSAAAAAADAFPLLGKTQPARK